MRMLRVTASLCCLLQLALASPTALPEAAPIAAALPAPTPIPNAIADPLAIAEAQPDGIYAPFSGAIYIINPAGIQYSAGQPAQCPANAGQVCANLGAYNW
jgi:hypothetical protein